MNRRSQRDSTSEVGSKRLLSQVHSSQDHSAKRAQGSDEEESNEAHSVHEDDDFIKITEKEKIGFEKLSLDTQKLCIKVVSRLFLFKASKQEVIQRSNIIDVLKNVENEYKKFANVVLNRVQKKLWNTFGYNIIRVQDQKDDLYFLINGDANQNLSKVLCKLSQSHTAYQGFKTAVFMAILMSPGFRITLGDLLRKIRQFDSRFPATISTGRSNATTLAVPELHEDFMGLINRMRKEGYISVEKDEMDKNDANKTSYKFGPRFDAEIGKTNLLSAYFEILGQPPNPLLMKEIERSDQSHNQEENEDN